MIADVDKVRELANALSALCTLEKNNGIDEDTFNALLKEQEELLYEILRQVDAHA
jgi:hypothetical protein